MSASLVGSEMCIRDRTILAQTGLPPAMAYMPGAAVWGVPVPEGDSTCPVWQEPPAEVARLLESSGVAEASGLIDFSKLWAFGQGAPQHEELPEVEPCVFPPPGVPNIYTDGSVLPPERPVHAMAGIGLWVPE
eukprot:6044890-Alexandrium_andersonii.AAC.1